jgi:hypothetical protein
MRGRLAHQILVNHTPWMRNQGKRTFNLTTSTNTHKHDHKQPMLDANQQIEVNMASIRMDAAPYFRHHLFFC